MLKIRFDFAHVAKVLLRKNGKFNWPFYQKQCLTSIEHLTYFFDILILNIFRIKKVEFLFTLFQLSKCKTYFFNMSDVCLHCSSFKRIQLLHPVGTIYNWIILKVNASIRFFSPRNYFGPIEESWLGS